MKSGLPKKYAKMGFKKGWKAYKLTKTTKRKAPMRTTTMAKRRKRTNRPKAVYKKAKRRISRGIKNNPLMTSALTSGVYGAVRGRTSNALVPLVSRIPVLNHAGAWLDNITMIGLTGLLANGKIPVIKNLPYSRDLGKNGWVVEWAMLGSDLAGSFSSTQSNSPNSIPNVG